MKINHVWIIKKMNITLKSTATSVLWTNSKWEKKENATKSFAYCVFAQQNMLLKFNIKSPFLYFDLI